MSNRPTPAPDPVEDRLRRTFAVKAEDMASGDADDTYPDLIFLRPADPPSLARRTRRPLQAAAVVVVVALVAAGAAFVARDGDPGEADRATTTHDAPAGESSAATAMASRALVVALQDERALATAQIIGMEEVFALPVYDTAQARSATDAAVAALDASVGSSPDGTAGRPSLDALGGLGQLRADVDAGLPADPASRNLNNLPASQELFGRYAAIVLNVIAEQHAYAETIDDPEDRTGAVAYGRGLQIVEQTLQLVDASLWAQLVPGTVAVADVGGLHTGVQQGLDALRAETAGTPYAEAADTLAGEVDRSGLLEATGGLLAGGPVDISVLIEARDLLVAESLPAFLDTVEDLLAEEG